MRIMAKWLVRPASFLIAIFILVAPAVGWGTSHYTVEPVPQDQLDKIPSTIIEPVPITFWDLGPREMAIFIALSISPTLVFPVEILFSVKILAWLGYRRIVENAVLRNQKRLMIFEAVITYPGIGFSALSRLTGIKRGPLRYHLAILEMRGKIIDAGTPDTGGYFENSGKFTGFEKNMFRHLWNTTTRKILGILLASPDISRKKLGGMIGIAGPSVTWHTNRLAQSGILAIEKTGREVRYTLTKETLDFFQDHSEDFPDEFREIAGKKELPERMPAGNSRVPGCDPAKSMDE